MEFDTSIINKKINDYCSVSIMRIFNKKNYSSYIIHNSHIHNVAMLCMLYKTLIILKVLCTLLQYLSVILYNYSGKKEEYQ